MSGFKKSKEELPSKERFYSSLTCRNISGKEYEHVHNVRNKFEMKMMKDYHDLYLKCDILLLADVFEKFRNNGLKVVSARFLVVCFSSLKKSTCETWKNVFYFTSKALLILEKIKLCDVIKCLSIKQEIHFTE